MTSGIYLLLCGPLRGPLRNFAVNFSPRRNAEYRGGDFKIQKAKGKGQRAKFKW